MSKVVFICFYLFLFLGLIGCSPTDSVIVAKSRTLSETESSILDLLKVTGYFLDETEMNQCVISDKFLSQKTLIPVYFSINKCEVKTPKIRLVIGRFNENEELFGGAFKILNFNNSLELSKAIYLSRIQNREITIASKDGFCIANIGPALLDIKCTLRSK